MKKTNLLLLSVMIATFSFAQSIDAVMNAKEVERVERILSADDMQGRRAFTPGIDKAAAFIADEFKKTGLQTLGNNGNYLQSFVMIRPKLLSVSGTVNNVAADRKNVIVISSQPELSITERSGYEKVTIAKGKNFGQEARKYVKPAKNYLVTVDPEYAESAAPILARLTSQFFKSDYSVVFLITATDPATYNLVVRQEITEMKLANVVGVLPGKSKKDEYVIFSGHYDHLGIMGKDRQGNILADSIFNGANDDAAGTTAVIMLAKYFKALRDNERTLIFVAFTAEEVGGYGASYFSGKFNPAQVMAMFNIEMIGTDSKWGKNSAYITGYEKTDMGKILQGNLAGTDFTFYPDPYTTENLFYRSDNATLARLGVPAHTISTAKMDSEPHYHKASDEIGTLDMENMAMIIKAIAISSKGIVSGKQTPSRVDTNSLTR